MDKEFQNYMLLVKNYNDQLKQRGTDWLGPEDLGDVLLKTAAQTGMKMPKLGGRKKRS